MAELTPWEDIDLSSIALEPGADYASGFNPKTILRDPRFLQDLRDYYREKGDGGDFSTDEELVDQFMSDKLWSFLNTVSAGKEAYQAYTESPDQKARMSRLQRVYDGLPNFLGEQFGGRSALETVADGTMAALLDPINLLAGAGAYKNAVQAGRGALAVGKSGVRPAVIEGAKTGAKTEAIIGAGQMAVLDTANQLRDVELGIQDEFSYGRLAGSSALGGVAGGVIGGGIGAVTGLPASKMAQRQFDAALFRGFGPEEIAGFTNKQAEAVMRDAQGRMGPFDSADAQAAREEARMAGEEGAPQASPTSETDEAVDTPVDPVDAQFSGYQEKLQAQINANRERLARLKVDEADEAVIAEQEARLIAITRLRGVIERLKNEQKEIIALGETSDVGSLGKRDARLGRFERDLADLDALLRQTDTLDPEEIITRIEAKEAERAKAAEIDAAKTKAEAEASAPTDQPNPAAAADEPAAQADEAVADGAAAADQPPVTATPTTEATTNVNAPAQAGDQPIPYRSEKQREAIATILRNSGFTEDELRGWLATMTLGRDGKLTRQTMAEIRARAESLRGSEDLKQSMGGADSAPASNPTQPATGTTTPTGAPISAELRGQALFDGVDYRTLEGAAGSQDGRITKRTLNKATKERAGARDAYPDQVQKELDDMLEMVNGYSLETEDLRAALRMLSADEKVKSSADDIIALFDHIVKRMDDSVENASDTPVTFTKTELKDIKRRARVIRKQNPELTVETAEMLARGEIVRQRGNNAPVIRGSGESIERAAALTTAGRNPAGRIQSFLRKGTRIGKGSDYTVTGANQVRPNEFGFEEALIKARSGNGPDIVPFVLSGNQVVSTPNGKVKMPKGSVAYADAVTGRAYDSMEFAVQMRDGGRRSSRLTSEDANPAPATSEAAASNEVTEQIRKAIATGDSAGFRKMLESLRNNSPSAPKPKDEPVVVAEKLPLTKGDKLLIVRKKSDPTDVRMISPKQAQAGKDITAIIGKKSSPDDWEVKYAPRERYTSNDAALTALFNSLPEEAGAREAVAPGGRYYAGGQTGTGRPMNAAEMKETVVGSTMTEAEREVLRRASTRYQFISDASTDAANLGDVVYATVRLESAKWPVDQESRAAVVESLKTLYGIIARHAPNGYTLTETSRAQSIEQLDRIMSRYSAEEQVAARKLLEGLGGDPTTGPRFTTTTQDKFHVATFYDEKGRLGQKININGKGGAKPVSNIVYHEVGHWAYFNILTPADRLEYWQMMSKYYNQDAAGAINREKIRENLSVYNGMQLEDVRLLGTNADRSPQEFFADNFERWVTRTRAPQDVREASFWNRVTRYIKAVFDRYMFGSKIDADLEPLFAKILPPEERNLRTLGVNANPATEAGRHYHKRFVELRQLRQEMDDAIDRDSADAIINAASELTRFLLSVAPKGSKAERPNTGTLAPLKRLYRMIHQRIDDMDEIVSGKPFDYEELGGVDRLTSEYADNVFGRGIEDMGDPQAIADLLRDHYLHGYAGQFSPAKGLPGAIKKLEKSSTVSLLDMVETALDGAFRSAENGDMASAAARVKEGARSERPKSSSSVKRSRKRVAQRDKLADADAKKTAATPASKRVRTSRKTKEIDPQVAESVKGMSIAELRKEYLTHRGTPRGDQVALELVTKEKAQPLPPKAVKIPRKMVGMREEELRTTLLDALYENDTKMVDAAVYELQRRWTNRGLKKLGMAKIEPVFNDSIQAIIREVDDNIGVMSNDAIPPSARASVRELLSYITHRDPEIQATARTMTYRMLNLMGKTTRHVLGETNVLATGDIARFAGVDPSDMGTSVFADMRAPEFRKLRADMRRLSIGLTKGESNPFDVIHEVGHTIIRSGAIGDAEMDAIREAFRLANDVTKNRIKAAYGSKYKDRITGVEDDLLAEEWFAESLAHYMAERTTRGDILEAALEGDLGGLKLRGTLDRAIDRAVEYVAYVINGLVGRNDIKQQFRRLFLFGDMFEKPRVGPLNLTARTNTAFHPSLAADVAADSIMASPRPRLAKIKSFIGDGISYDPVTDSFVTFYHGTPNGSKLRRTSNPDVVMRISANGNYGPGVYLGSNPHVADEVFAKRPTLESIRNQVMDADLPDEVKNDLIFDAMDLAEVRNAISRYRRMYAQEMANEGNPDKLATLQQALDDFVEVETGLLDGLTARGIETDPLVLPVYTRMKYPADFQITAVYENTSDPMIAAVIRTLNMTGTLDQRAYKRFKEAFDNGPMDGRDTYKSLVRLYMDSGRSKGRAQAELNETLEDLGYDGLLTTHWNTLDTQGDNAVMANGNTYRGSVTQYQGVVVFDPANVKHIDASDFDATDARLYHRSTDTAVPRGTVGGVVEGILNESILTIREINPGSLGEALEAEGASPSFTGAIMSMLRGRGLNAKEETALRDFGPVKYFSSQSSRMKNIGAHWLGDWYKNHFPDLHQKFAKKYFPIHHALRALPDADGNVRAWARRASANVGQAQPKSYQRIVRALRFGAGSRQEKALNNQERAIWSQIRTAFANERKQLIGMGIHVGDRGPNYLPQVWNPEKIRKNQSEFLSKMAHYYKIEKTAHGQLAKDTEAMDFARGIFETLAGDGADGVYVPIKGGSRNPKFENVDFSRVIELEKYPAALKELESFLEDDLEFLLVKYFEGSNRRISHVEKMGVNSHALYDYMMVAEQGTDGIARLLSTNKEFRRDVRSLGEGGYMEYGTMVDTIRMPFAGNEFGASEFARQLVSVHNEKGSAAARQLLEEAAPTSSGGNVPITYKRRMDAILGALDDFKGQKANWKSADYEFIENAMRVAMKKPQVGTGAKSLMNVSKAMRSFNNVTLLGFTTLTSLGDVALPVIRSGSMQDWVKGLYKWRTDPEYRQMLHDVGVAMENIVHERMVYMYGAVDNKMSNAFFNATMLTPWTDMNRQIAGATGYETFKTMQRKAVKNYKQGVDIAGQNGEYKTAHRFLSRYGLDSYLPTGEKATISLSDRALLETDETLRAGIIKFADESIFQPNPNDVPLWAQTPVGAMVFQLKSFPLMMTRLGGYVLGEAKKGNLKPLAYFATLGPAFGMGALATKDVIQMRGGEDGVSAETRKRNLLKTMGYDEKIHGNEDDFLGWYVEGMLMMGGLGLLGDVIHSTVTQADNGAYGKVRIASTFLGPSFGDFMAGVEVLGGITDSGENSNAKERSAMREIATRVPVLGGVRKLREGIVDATAGEAQGRGGDGWTADWNTGWKTKDW